MLQLRFVLWLLLIIIVAVSALSVQTLKEEGLQQSLVDVDGQGHENIGERLARQYFSRGEIIARQNRQSNYNRRGGRYRGRYGRG